MKLPFLFIKSTQFEQQQQQTWPWPWPSCGNSTKTLSFRNPSTPTTTTADMFKTVNSTNAEMGIATEPTPQLGGGRVDSEDDSVIQGATNRKQSERLFFTPGETNSILEEAKSKNINKNGFLGIKEIDSMVMEEMESTNPYVDFRKSMEEMVEANEGLKGSMEGLQELLSCYLTVNGKNNHGYIVGAFIDLLTSLSFDQEDEQNHNNNDFSSSSNSPISALSFNSNSSSCTSSTARTATPCSVEEGGGVESTSSSSTNEKTIVVVDEDNDSPCSSQV